MQLRKSLGIFFKLSLEFIKSFFSTSNIHGFNHISAPRRHPAEILIWASLVDLSDQWLLGIGYLALAIFIYVRIGLGLYGAAILSGMTLTRYQENPTVIAMERDRFSWNTSFPAATICPSSKINQALLEVYTEKSTSENKTALKDFIMKLSQATFENFETVPFYDHIRADDYMDILYELNFEFKPTVSNSGINGHQYYLQEVITEMGICYCFNSQLALYNSPHYRSAQRWDVVTNDNDTFYINPLDGEVFANVVNMSTGFNIFIHGAYEVADVASKVLSSSNGFFLQVYLTALALYSSGRAKGLKVNQRKCRYYDESNLQHSPVYSFVLCRMECRAQLSKKLCDCIPHFYRKLDGEKTCDVKGLHCLGQHKERLIMLKKECNCLPNCDEVNYIVDHVDTREWFLGSNLQWGLKEYPRMRLKRDVLFGFTDLLVYIGGMAGLFCGCSVLSFIEIIYFFTLRLFWYIINYKYETKKMIKNSKISVEKY